VTKKFQQAYVEDAKEAKVTFEEAMHKRAELVLANLQRTHGVTPRVGRRTVTDRKLV